MPTVDRELALVGWDDEVAARLRAAQQAELRDRYGDDDIGHTMTGDGIVAMVVARVDGVPVACGAVRDVAAEHGPGVGELKRMYVLPEARGRGHARAVLVELERVAAGLGLRRLVLETGVLQPEAIGLYLACGYRSTPNFGEYVGVTESRCFAKDLDAPVRPRAAGRGGVSSDVVVREVAWSDERAVALRRRMWDFNAALYPEVFAPGLFGAADPDGAFAVDDPAQGVGALATFVAEVAGGPVGCVTLRERRAGYPDGSAELKKLFVADEARGLGAGRALLAAADRAATERGATSLVLATGIHQPEAVGLYLATGWLATLPYVDATDDLLSLWFAKRLGRLDVTRPEEP